MTDWEKIEKEANAMLGLKYSDDLFEPGNKASRSYLWCEIPYSVKVNILGNECDYFETISENFIDDLYIRAYSEKVSIVRKYHQSDKGKKAKKSANAKYAHTEKGKSAITARRNKKRIERCINTGYCINNHCRCKSVQDNLCAYHSGLTTICITPGCTNAVSNYLHLMCQYCYNKWKAGRK
jgi:hypothetical protein